MKKALSVILSVLLILSFTACSNNAPVEEEKKEEAKPSPVITVADLSSLGDIRITSLEIKDNFAVMIYNICDNYDEYSIAIYDVDEKKIVGSKPVDVNAFVTDFDNDLIRVWSRDPEKFDAGEPDTYELFDFALNDCGSGTGDHRDIIDIATQRAEEIGVIDEDTFTVCESVAYDYCLQNEVLVFYDNPMPYFIKSKDEKTFISASDGMRILEKTEDYESKDVKLVVSDFDKMKSTSPVEIKLAEKENINRVKMNNTFACFDTVKESGEYFLYVWEYGKADFDNEIEATAVSDVEAVNNQLIEEIKNDYQIDVKINPKSDKRLYEHGWTNDLPETRMLICLFSLRDCLKEFPLEFYTELTCKDMEEPICSFEKLCIYLIGDLNDDGDIHYDALATNLNDNLYIVYGCTAFSYYTFFHEFMHNMDYRIWNYAKDWNDEWTALNPDGFEYDSNYFEKYDEDESYADYFIMEYSTRNIDEDRATVFGSICEDKICPENSGWKEKAHINEKVESMKKAVYSSFPSLNECQFLG